LIDLFCIAEYGHRESTLRVIDSIASQKTWSPVFVGNDAHPSPPAPIPGVTVFDYDLNVGYSGNMNRLVRDAMSSYPLSIIGSERQRIYTTEETVLFCCNDDIEFLPGSIAELSRFARDNFCVVGPTLVTPGSLLNPSGFGDHPQFVREDALSLRWMDPEKLTMVCGACLVMPMEIWNAVGGFDLDYRIYFNDDQLGMDAASLGYSVFVDPRAVVRHHAGLTMGFSQKAIEEARQLFISKNPGRTPDGTGRY